MHFVQWDAKHLEQHIFEGQSVKTVAYPMDRWTIKKRLENGFYRRRSAVQFDVKYIYDNAAVNCPGWCRRVCKARKLVRILTAFLSDETCTAVNGILRSKRYRVSVSDAADGDSSSDDEEIIRLVVEQPRKARKAAQKWHDRQDVEKIPPERLYKPKMDLRERRSRRRNTYIWEFECSEVVEALMEMPESVNFRMLDETPFELVLRMEKPLFLATVSERLLGESPIPFADISEFGETMCQLFKNAFSLYGHDKESQDYLDKKKLWKCYDDLIKPILANHTARPSKVRCVE